MIDRPARVIHQQILLADISNIGGIVILREQMVERLILARARVCRNLLIPFFAVGKNRINIEDHAAEQIQPVAHDIAD